MFHAISPDNEDWLSSQTDIQNKKRKFFLKKVVVILSVLLSFLVTSSSLASSNKGIFEFKSDGSIYVNALDCENPRVDQHAKLTKRATKIKHVNHLIDEVDQISSQFLRINGKLYDAYVAEFQRNNIDKTHNISNSIVEKEFRAVDKEEQYFTDGINYYYKKYYPTSNACLHRTRTNTSIELSEFKLESLAEAKFYLSVENNIFTPDGSYTLFSELNEKLYYKRKSGKFVEVPGANPKTLRNIGKKYISHFFTDGQHLIFQGEVIGSDFDSFKRIKTGKKDTFYYKIGGYIYRLYTPSITPRYDGTLTKTDFDAETFEVLDPTGNGVDRIYQDKSYIYSHKKGIKNWEVTKKARK
jgi:hypothetical protein